VTYNGMVALSTWQRGLDWMFGFSSHRQKGVWKCGLFPEFIAMSVMFVILDLFMVHVWFYGGEDGLPLCFGSF